MWRKDGQVGTEPCPLSGDTVPRAEHELVKRERDQMEVRLDDVRKDRNRLFNALVEAQAAANWKDVTDRPLSAMDILGRDRDEWKAIATKALEENRALKFAAAQKRIVEEHHEIFAALAEGPKDE